jgi:hypothetical protein
MRPSWLPVPSPLQALPLPATPLAAAGFLIRRTTAGLQIPPQQGTTAGEVLSAVFPHPSRWRPWYSNANRTEVRQGPARLALRGAMATSREDQERSGTVTQGVLGAGIAIDAAIGGSRGGKTSTEGRRWQSEMGIQWHDMLAWRIGCTGFRLPSRRAISRGTVSSRLLSCSAPSPLWAG